MAIAIAQNVATPVEDFDGGASSQISTPGSTTAGNLLVLSISGFNAAGYGTPTITDSQGNAWTVHGAVPVSNSSGLVSGVLASAVAGSSAALTVTVTHAHATGNDAVTLGLCEVSGMTSPGLDKFASNQGAAAGTTLTTTTAATTVADEIVIAVLAQDGSSGTGGGSEPSGYTVLSEQLSSSGTVLIFAYKIVAATGAQSATWDNLDFGFSSNNGTAGLVGTFGAGLGGGGGGGITLAWLTA